MMMVRGLGGAVLALMLGMTVAPLASAHSVEEAQQELRETERYFQPVDRAAPGFTLRSADERTVSLVDFRGKVVVMHFIYTSCPDVCPLHSERIARVQEMVNRTPMKDRVRFVTITTDPAHDTPAVLRAYGAAHGLDPVDWVLLTAASDQPEDITRKIAESYGLKFTAGQDGYQMHGVVTHVIDQDGRLRARFHGLKWDPASLVTFISAVAEKGDPHAHDGWSLWDKVRDLF